MGLGEAQSDLAKFYAPNFANVTVFKVLLRLLLCHYAIKNKRAKHSVSFVKSILSLKARKTKLKPPKNQTSITNIEKTVK
jgi:hypothetical protein